MTESTETPRPICPLCREPGIHGSTEQCLDTLRAAIDRARTQLAHRSPEDPAVAHLGRWVPSFYP